MSVQKKVRAIVVPANKPTSRVRPEDPLAGGMDSAAIFHPCMCETDTLHKRNHTRKGVNQTRKHRLSLLPNSDTSVRKKQEYGKTI